MNAMILLPYSVEIAVVCLIVAVLVADMFSVRGTNGVWAVYMAGIAAVLVLAVLGREEGSFFNGAYTADGLSWIAKIVLVIGAGLTGGISLRGLPIRRKYHGAYAALLLGATLGMMILVSSQDLLTMYVGLETSAISLYGLTALSKTDDLSLEAGIKYLVIGALSSGILLYGLALIYTGTGATTLEAIRVAAASSIASGSQPNLLLTIGAILVLLGVGFKLSMVPMHVWTPDVYQGAPTPVAAFISVVSKSAGFVFAIRLFTFAFADLRHVWEPLVIVGAVLSMTVGNLAAIPQKSMKRLLAYSSISQAGYILVGFLGTPASGTNAVMFYLFVYTLSNLAAFGAVVAFSSAAGSDNLDDYSGLARREPVLGLHLRPAFPRGNPASGRLHWQVLLVRSGDGEGISLAGYRGLAEQRGVPVLLPDADKTNVHRRVGGAKGEANDLLPGEGGPAHRLRGDLLARRHAWFIAERDRCDVVECLPLTQA